MFRSFRLKIGLLSVILSGLLLGGFGLLAVSALNRVGLDRMDRELRALADAQVRKEQPPGHWQRFDDSLRSLYREGAPRQFLLKVTTPEGDRLHVSKEWPANLPDSALPLPLGREPSMSREEPPPETPPSRDEEMDARRPRPFNSPRPRPPPPRPMSVRGPVYATIGNGGSGWRVMTLANDNVTLSMAMSLAGLHAEVLRFERILLIAVPIGLLLIVAGGWLIGHMALRPVKLIAQTAESVTADRLQARIPDKRADAEFRRLIALINGMLERLERSFRQATRFSADAAHELKTPLAILQAQVERSLQQAADNSPEQREYAEQLDEIQRLKAILGKLLLLSQADAGQLPLSRDKVNLAETVRASAEDVRILAPDRQLTVHAPGSAMVEGDAHLLNQVIENLASNAVKFGEAGGIIEMTLTEVGGQALFTIRNTGIPIPAGDGERVFERFYRADKSRCREIEGTGLGLSLAREIARAHGGDLILTASNGNGTVFRLTLPALQPPATGIVPP